MERQRAGRLTAVPQLDVPEILVDGEDRDPIRPQQRPRPQGSGRPQLSVDVGDHFLGGRGLDAQQNTTSPESAYQHPLSQPRASTSGLGSSTGTSSKQRGTTSAFSFELYEPDEQQHHHHHHQQPHQPQQPQQPMTEQSPRRGSAISPTVSSILDESVWVESLRRGATLRQSRQG